jgi:hypothetical protein
LKLTIFAAALAPAANAFVTKLNCSRDDNPSMMPSTGMKQ